MRYSENRAAGALAVLCVLLCGGCSDSGPAASDHSDHDHEHEHADQDGEAMDGPTNRIDIPRTVRRNLGITFADAQARRVAQTIRVPGRFEYQPTAKREYRTMLPGQVELLVDQFDRVEPGDALYRIDSPAWREHQQRIRSAEAAIDRLTTRLASYQPLRDAHRNHEAQLEQLIAVRRERIEQLEQVAQAGGGRAAERSAAQSDLATAEAQLAEVLEKESELEADEYETSSELAAARANRELLLDTAATLTGLSADALQEETDSPRGTEPRWRTLKRITVRAEEAGVVESLEQTNGAWANEENTVLVVTQPNRLRFRAVGLQSDLGRLRDDQPARIVAPSPTRAAGSIDLQDTMSGTMSLGLSGDPNERTIELYMVPETLSSWARPGVSAQLEIVTSQTESPVLAIPKAAVQRDGLTPVFFLRDRQDPNKAVRVEADLGMDDGRWVEVRSGLTVGDEVVLDGAYQLMLATSDGGEQRGGHFHADGTFHSDDEP